jgi:hypothetical protein
VVSGLGVSGPVTSAAPAHADVPAAYPSPPVSAATALVPAAAHAPVTGVEAPAVVPAKATKPVRLSDVHERLAAALAELRTPSGHGPGAAAADAAAHGAAGASDARRSRVVLTWPKPRWQVAWPAPGRVALTWPEVAAAEPPAATIPPPQH